MGRDDDHRLAVMAAQQLVDILRDSQGLVFGRVEITVVAGRVTGLLPTVRIDPARDLPPDPQRQR